MSKCQTLKLFFVMKRITFIEPVACMQGKLSANRKLTYPTRDNSAWDAPTGKSYATNYRPSYIGNLRKKDGVTYFGTKVRSSVTMNSDTRLVQALLGASVSITASMLKVPQILSIVQTAYLINQPEGLTMYKWCQAEVRSSLEVHTDFSFISSTGFKYIQNPFIETHHAGSIAITGLNTELIAKFWSQLATNPRTFKVGSKEGVAHSSDDFDAIITGSYNVLGLSSSDEAIAGHHIVKQGELFVSFQVEGQTYAAVVDRPLNEQCDDPTLSSYILTETAQDIFPL